MINANFIAAIDLGTSHITGMLGKKNAGGALSILACETESSAGCIKRGCVYNVDEAAGRIKSLITKLEMKLQPGSRIEKVYVGIGGQSIRSVEHTVSRMLEADDVVTDGMINRLYEECKTCKPDMLDVLDIVSPAYYLDGKLEPHPVGIPCKKIEARYKLIVGRPSLRQYMLKSIQKHARIDIAGIVVSPLALDDVVLSEDEKSMGCAVINFGAGVTSLTVYKEGLLAGLCVIPLGGNLITKDLKKLMNVVETEAERIKQTYGSATANKDNDISIPVGSADGIGIREIKLSDISPIIEARSQEILENVYARLEEMGVMNALGAGIIITGGASALKNLKEAIHERLGKPVRYAAIRKGIVEKTHPEADVATGLLYQGTENCVIIPPSPEQTKPPVVTEPADPPVTPDPHEQKSPKQPNTGGLLRKIKKTVKGMGQLFDEENT